MISSQLLFKHGSRRLLPVLVAHRSAAAVASHQSYLYIKSSSSAIKRNIINLRYMATVSMDNNSNIGVSSSTTSTTMSSSSSSTGAKQETTKEQQQQQMKLNPMPDFTDAQAAYATKTTSELVRAAVVFSLCRIQFLVRHSENMLRLSRRILGDTFTDFVLRQTMFGHFCAGENEMAIIPTIHALERAGIGSILDFAAEDDGAGEHAMKKKKKSSSSSPPVRAAAAAAGDDAVVYNNDDHDHHHVLPNNKAVVARVYDYESEAQCDAHVATFKRCINHVKNLGPDGYAAIKVTALGNPKLLQRMSHAIVETQNLFRKFDINGDGIISRDEFEHGFKLFFHNDETKLRHMLDEISSGAVNSSNSSTNGNSTTSTTGGGSRGGDYVDYITWSMTLSPSDLPQITSQCRDIGPLAMATPTQEEVELIENLYKRGHVLAQEAAACGTRLLIDAEQVRFQPAIDNLVLELQRKHNCIDVADFPIIYNTYQCYLKDAPHRLATDVERSERFHYHFGAKLVRGAYMESERALAQLRGYPSPIHNSIQETHDCYNACVNFLLSHASSSSSSSSLLQMKKKKKKKTEMMLATHNQQSIEKAIDAMNEHGISRHGGGDTADSSSSSSSSICFGQLLGMADNLSFNLGKHGYRAYKYVPYGEIKMVMPYLIRRANENSALAGSGAAQELNMIQKELKRRLFGFLGFA